jgi:hypothetical protein
MTYDTRNVTYHFLKRFAFGLREATEWWSVVLASTKG